MVGIISIAALLACDPDSCFRISSASDACNCLISLAKVLQFQTPIFSLNTKGAWTLRFDDILADALEQGPLQNYEITIPEELRQKVEKLSGKKAAPYICDLIAYYHTHREDDCDWVILPVTNFNAYLGASFGRKYLPKLPKELCERNEHSHGVCRFRVDVSVNSNGNLR